MSRNFMGSSERRRMNREVQNTLRKFSGTNIASLPDDEDEYNPLIMDGRFGSEPKHFNVRDDW